MILLMFNRHLVAHIWAKLDFQNLMAAMLDFVDLMHITGQRKNDNIVISHLRYILKLNV